MFLSIIIPVYNCEKYIKKCLDSLPLNNKQIEIIVVNDGSNDNSSNIIRQYDNVKLIEIDNHGVSYARNLGIKKAIGKYLMFVDADDYLSDFSDEFISSIMSVVNENYYDIVYLYENIDINIEKKELIKNILGINFPCIAGPYCKLFRKDFIVNSSINFKKDLINGEDMLFNLEAIISSNNYMILNKSIYMYRQVMSSATKRFDHKLIESDNKFQDYIEKIINKTTYKEELKKEIVAFTYSNAILTFLDRIAYLNSYNKFKKNIKEAITDRYIKYMNSSDKKFINNRKKIIFILYRFKLYRLIYILFKIKHKRIKNKEFFIKI